MCEEHLSVKPSVARQGCKRLGHASHDKPRKLLIHLNSEFAATSLLSVAKELRTSDNATIAANVYINPDLSPADAKLAFEQRQRKRERKLANAPTFQAPQQTTLMVATTSSSTSSTQALSTPSSATTTTAQPASAKRISTRSSTHSFQND